MNRDQILEIADDMANTTIIMPKNEDLIAFAEAIIQHHKDSVLKEVGEPVGYGFIDLNGKCHHIRQYQQSAMYVAEKEFDSQPLFTADQLLAARKPLEEEIERLKDQLEAAQEELSQADCLNGKIIAENGTLKEQLATAEQRVAEACTLLCMDAVTKSKSSLFRSGAIIVAGDIRDGEWRKFVKEV